MADVANRVCEARSGEETQTEEPIEFGVRAERATSQFQGENEMAVQKADNLSDCA